jgi:hypothetical protein
MRFLSLVLAIGLYATAVNALDRDKLAAFVEVTGFDVMVESLQQGAMAGPAIVGGAEETFGRQYTVLAEKVFDKAVMRERAMQIMSGVMTDELVDFGAEFYASDVGQRLVQVENASHGAKDDLKYTEGQVLLDSMVANVSPRIDLFQRMSAAIGSTETSLKAIAEIQVRFLLAAMAAGVMENPMPEQDLRLAIQEQIAGMGPQIEQLGLLGNIYTYRDISDTDLEAYVKALETPEMAQIYEVLNAVQYQIMIERYQELGTQLGELQPEQEL